jgi:hypothetical protein
MTERQISEIEVGPEKQATVDAVYDWTDAWLTPKDIAERRGKRLFVNTDDVASVADSLRALKIGDLLTAKDKQLALPADNYYPELDMRKEVAKPAGIAIDLAGYQWSDGSSSRSVYVVFGYTTPAGEPFQEKIGLYASPTNVYVNRSVFALEYSETGYEGHAHQGSYDYTSEDVRAFLKLVDSLLEPVSTKS